LVKFSNEFENQEMGKFENQEIEIQKSKVKKGWSRMSYQPDIFFEKTDRTDGGQKNAVF
jgi:hypothetical protein